MKRNSEKSMFTNMCMIYDDNGNVLVENRINIWPGICFPGGHLEEYESVVDSTIREIKEETGLDIFDLKLCGIKQWFNNEEGRNVCFLFKTNHFQGNIMPSNEGEVFWVERSCLKDLKLAEGFDKMLEVFENDELNEVYLDKYNEGIINLK